MAKFEDLAVRYIANIVRDFKLKPFQAAAFPGNFGHESGGFEQLQEINPIGGGRGGLGHGQFTGPRRVDFEQWIARHAMLGWNAGTFEANYSHLFRELTGNAASDESHVLPLLRAATTLEEATNIVCDKFERPNKDYAHKPERIVYAKRALAAFEASGINVAELMAAPRPGSTVVVEQEILPPLTKIDPNSLAPLLNMLLPVLLQLLAARTQQPGGTPTGQQPDILAILASLLGQPGLPQPVIVPKPPKPPEPVTPPATTPFLERPTVITGLGTFLAGFVAQLNGDIAPPVGETATLPGILTTVLPLAMTVLGGPLGGMVSRLFGSFTISRKSS